MSQPRFGWWSYVKNMIRRYPDLAEEYAALHEQGVTPAYSGMPQGGGEGRPLETVATRELPSVKQREFDAVHKAIQVTKSRCQNGKDRLAVVEYVFWSGHKGRQLLYEAAEKVHYSYDAVKKFHREFILLVASFYGLLDEENTHESQKNVL